MYLETFINHDLLARLSSKDVNSGFDVEDELLRIHELQVKVMAGVAIELISFTLE